MGARDKLVKRFLSLPADFSWNELITLLSGFGYYQVKTSKTGGARIRFFHDSLPPIILHRPHPARTLKRYQMEQIQAVLRKEGVL